MFFIFSGEEPFIAIIGDMIDSKHMIDRAECQEKMHLILDIINKKYSEDIASKFLITLGDEFQGLLKYGRNTINIITEIETAMYPVQIRFGIGVGTITTDINPDYSLGADGPAYYNARMSVDTLKQNKKKSRTIESDIMIISGADNEGTDMLLNTIISVCTAIKLKWTKRQREVVYDVLEHGDNQREAAKRLGISQSSVQKSLYGAGYYTYRHAMDTVAEALYEIGVKDV